MIKRGRGKYGAVAWGTALVVAGALTLVGCSSDGNGGSSEGNNGAGEDGSENLSVGYLPKMLGNPYFERAAVGAEDAMKELGGEFTVVGPEVGAADAQAPFINTLAQQGRDGIILSASDPSALGQALSAAQNAGTSIVTFDSDVAEDTRDVFISPVPDRSLSEALVDELVADIGETGDIAILGASPDANNQKAWISGIKEYISESFPGLNIVEEFYTNDEEQASFDKTEGALHNNPGLKGIISTSTVGTASAARYLSDSSYKDTVNLTGIGMPNATRAYLEDGTLKSFVLFDPADMGYVGAYAIKALKEGTITGAEGDKFSAGDRGEYTVEANGVVQAGTPIVFNMDNIDDFDF